MGKTDSWITKITRLKNSKVARFSYRAEAYANDEIEGVASYDYAQDMNVPLATHTDFEPSMLSIGARTNFSVIPKNGLNHFFGRVSYNLNKVIDFLSDLLDDFISFTEILYFPSAGFLETYPEGTTKRLLNTSAGIVDITLPLGETYNSSQVIKLEPMKLLVILKIGTTWINAGSGDGTAVDNIPAASEVYEGKILQYIGITDEDYTSGWFYKCVETSPSVYEWIDIQVQDTPSNIITGFYENGKLWKGTNAEYLALDESVRTNNAITFIITDIEVDVPQLISDSTISAETTWSSSKIEKLTNSLIMTGIATLNGSTDNTIQLTGIVTTLGLEIGDVIRIEYSGYNKLHTVETIANNNSIIVNYEHAGNRGNGSLKLEDKTNVSATVELLTKWYNAPIGLGQAGLKLTSSIVSADTAYTNSKNRPIFIAGGFVGTNGALSVDFGEGFVSYTSRNANSFNDGGGLWILDGWSFKVSTLTPFAFLLC